MANSYYTNQEPWTPGQALLTGLLSFGLLSLLQVPYAVGLFVLLPCWFQQRLPNWRLVLAFLAAGPLVVLLLALLGPDRGPNTLDWNSILGGLRVLAPLVAGSAAIMAFGLLPWYGMLLLCGRPVYTDTPPCRACEAPQPPGHPARCCECDAALPTIPAIEERQPD